MEEALKNYEQFSKAYNMIDKELQDNGQLSIDVMLLNNNPGEVINAIILYAPRSFELLKNNEKMRDYFITYLFEKKSYFDNLSISNDKLGKLLAKPNFEYSSSDSRKKEESLYYNEKDQEKYLDDILKRLIDCTNLYFDLYHNKNIPIQLGDGTKLELQFLYKNLLHILGITQEQVKNNPELMKALNIDPNKVQNLHAEEILERIIKDIQTNKDILCLQMQKKISKYNKESTSKSIVSTQVDSSTSTEMLPYDKIDIKTRAFINSGPYSDVSVISELAPGSFFIANDAPKPDNQRDIQQARISKTDFNTLEKDKVTIETKDGDKIDISRGDYIFNGYTKNPGDVRTLRSAQVGTSKKVIDDKNGNKTDNLYKFKKMFNGQTPIPIVGVENPGDGTTLIFTPEQQKNFFLSLYYDFSGEGGMNFEPYIEMLNQFAERFKNELEQQAIAKTQSGIIIPSQGRTK